MLFLARMPALRDLLKMNLTLDYFDSLYVVSQAPVF